jgi:hypothetical protein
MLPRRVLIGRLFAIRVPTRRVRTLTNGVISSRVIVRRVLIGRLLAIRVPTRKVFIAGRILSRKVFVDQSTDDWLWVLYS